MPAYMAHQTKTWSTQKPTCLTSKFWSLYIVGYRFLLSNSKYINITMDSKKRYLKREKKVLQKILWWEHNAANCKKVEQRL